MCIRDRFYYGPRAGMGADGGYSCHHAGSGIADRMGGTEEFRAGPCNGSGKRITRLEGQNHEEKNCLFWRFEHLGI